MTIRQQTRTLRTLAELEGLMVLELSHRGSGHLGLRVRNASGQVTTMIASASPSDRRSRLNLRSQLRRFARASATQAYTPAATTPENTDD